MLFTDERKSLSSDYYEELISDIYTMATYARELGLEIPDSLKKDISILVYDNKEPVVPNSNINKESNND